MDYVSNLELLVSSLERQALRAECLEYSRQALRAECLEYNPLSVDCTDCLNSVVSTEVGLE